MSKELIKQEAAELMPRTSKELSEIWAPVNCMRKLTHVKTVSLAMQSGTPTLGTLKREFGEKSIEAYIKLWLIHLNQLLDLKKPLTAMQIDCIALQVLNNYRSLTIADIYLIFTNAINGEYGNFYDRLSIPTIMKWFKNYFNSRCDMAAEQSYMQHISSKERNNKPSAPSHHLLSKVKGVFSAARLAAEKNKDEIKKARKHDKLY